MLIPGIAAVYFGAAKFALTMAFVAEQVSPIWPPTGIALAALLLFGYRVWPGITLGAFLANITANESIGTACGIALGNTLEAVVGVLLLHHLVGFQRPLERLRDVFGLVGVAAAIAPTVSATVGVTSLCLGGAQQWTEFGALWFVWWLGDAMGAILITPLLLTWTTWPRQFWPIRRLIEAIVLLALLVGASLVVFAGLSPTRIFGRPLEYAVFPFLIWAALRFGQAGTATGILVTAAIATFGTVNGMGPFAKGSPHESLVLLQLFLIVVAVTALLLGATITELKRMEKELRRRAHQLAEADHRKDEFLAMLAHELRNPLAPLRNGVEILRLQSGNGPGAEQVVPMMQRQIQHLVRLVDDLLEVSRITRGLIELQKKRVTLAAVLESALETSRPIIDASGHKLTWSLPPGPLFLEADMVRLSQVFTNLLNNAARYTERGGHIDITAERQGDEAVIRVRDTGIGIAAELLPHVFEKFTRGGQSGIHPQGGLGIGLTLARSLVEMHGGRIEATSAGRGQGTVFTVHLPLAPDNRPPPAQEGLPADQKPAASTLRILVVDDNCDVAESLGMLLKFTGNEVKVANDGPSALEVMKRWRPAVVFVDLGMPGMDGFEVARRVRADPALKDMTLVALTGWSQDEDRQRSRQAGLDHHLIKPVKLDDLEALLASVQVNK
jgi:signal transduction histidine kinase/ActR/RegA family two-component response regulator